VEPDCCCHWTVDTNWMTKHLGKKTEARRIIREQFDHTVNVSYEDDQEALGALAETTKWAMLD
jgi:hypothetical protein